MTETVDATRRSSERETADHRRHTERLLARLPEPARRKFAWLLQPGYHWLRISLGSVLIIGGLFSFLPILGLWMLPLGALLLAEDVPIIRRPTTRAIDVVEHWWSRRQSSRMHRDDRSGDTRCARSQEH